MDNALEKLASIVFLQRPVLKDIYSNFGSQTLFDYINSWQVPKIAAHEVFIGTFRSLAAKLYGQSVADEAVGQLRSKPLVSTIDHHGLLGHPFFVNANLQMSLHGSSKYIITLPTAGVSMNNSSSWSGCLLYHKQGQLHKLALHPQSRTMHAVWQMPSLEAVHVQNFPQAAKSLLNQDERKEVGQLLEKVFSQDFSLFSDQAAVMSSRLWQQYFPGAPELLYIPLEDVINNTVAELLGQKNELWTFLLCHDKGLQIIENHFQGLAGAFAGPNKGSFLFWGVNEKGSRVHLRREGKMLIGHGIALELSSESLKQAIGKRQIYPTSLLCFLVLLFSNITCAGGFNQTSWLTTVKKEFTKLLRELGRDQLAEAISGMVTNNFAESPLAFLSKEGTLLPASGLDIIFEEDKHLYEKLKLLSQSLTLAESIHLELADMYRVIVPAQEQDRYLLAAASLHNGLLHEKAKAVLKN